MKKIVVFLIFISCNNENIRKKSYIFNDATFNCQEYINTKEVYREICFDPQKDTVSVINFENKKRNGVFKEHYKSNILKNVGLYKNGFKVGIWKEYYSNKKLKLLLYYDEQIDSSKLVYLKEYNEDGKLKRCSLPIDLSTNSEDGIYKIGYTYQLYIKLKFSVYNHCRVNGELDSNSKGQLAKLYQTEQPRTLICEFTPNILGDNVIQGQFYEYEGLYNNENFSGVTMFEFKYKSVK